MTGWVDVCWKKDVFICRCVAGYVGTRDEDTMKCFACLYGLSLFSHFLSLFLLFFWSSRSHFTLSLLMQTMNDDDDDDDAHTTGFPHPICSALSVVLRYTYPLFLFFLFHNSMRFEGTGDRDLYAGPYYSTLWRRQIQVGGMSMMNLMMRFVRNVISFLISYYFIFYSPSRLLNLSFVTLVMMPLDRPSHRRPSISYGRSFQPLGMELESNGSITVKGWGLLLITEVLVLFSCDWICVLEYICVFIHIYNTLRG